jgi:hypothetical protein
MDVSRSLMSQALDLNTAYYVFQNSKYIFASTGTKVRMRDTNKHI